MSGVLLKSKILIPLIKQYEIVLVQRYGVSEDDVINPYILSEIRTNKYKITKHALPQIISQIKLSNKYKKFLMNIVKLNDIDSEMSKLILVRRHLKSHESVMLNSTNIEKRIDEIFDILINEKVDLFDGEEQKGKRVVSHDDRLPMNLFKNREISSLSQLPIELGDNFYLLTRDMDACNELLKFGVKINSQGAYVNRHDDVKLEEISHLLPHVAKKIIKPLLGDLIPQSSWGSSLSNLLTKKSWDILRNKTFVKNGNRCEVCGAGGRLECHEFWEYHEPIIKDVRGVQRLDRLMSLCKRCHQIHHLGFMEAQGRLAEGLNRLTIINRWCGTEVDQYSELLMERFERRNESGWDLDVTIVDSDEPLIVSGTWELHNSGFLTKDNEYSPMTMLFGAKWKFPKGKDFYEARPIVEAYCK
jgi:hypothetical protein